MMKNLVITKAGRNSLHRTWVTEGRRNFDLWIFAYDEEATRNPPPTSRVVYMPSPKIAGWKKIFESYPEIFELYDQIALLDDDLEFDSDSISRCFDIGKTHNLLIWQPSLTWDSYATFGGLLQNKKFEIRYVNYIELMCPFFASSYLQGLTPLFSLGFEVGPDLIWCSLVDEPYRRFAVIDSIPVRHTRPVGVMKHINGFAGKTYEDDIHACLTHFRMRWPSLVASAGVTRGGVIIESRAHLALMTASLFGAFFSAPAGERRTRLRIIMDHVRHQFMRPCYFGSESDVRALMLTVPTFSELSATLGTQSTVAAGRDKRELGTEGQTRAC